MDKTISGILTNRAGERVIPQTRRKDGSVRPERKVRDGYQPQEDLKPWEGGPRSQKPPERFANGVVGLLKEDQKAQSTGMSASAKKNAARREKKKQQKAEAAS